MGIVRDKTQPLDTCTAISPHALDMRADVINNASRLILDERLIHEAKLNRDGQLGMN